MSMDKRKKTVLSSFGAAFVLVIIGLVSGNLSILANFIVGAVMIAILPFFIQKYMTYRWVKDLESQFPNFVRDLSDSRRSGMSFPESIKIASRANYGHLSPEIMTMHNKLSWGVPFPRVLDMFKFKLKDSKLITESVTIIKESYLSGGNVASTLDAIARDILMLKETEAERVSMVKQNVLIMYGIFYMFLGIAIMIIFVMIPMIKSQPAIQTGGFGFSFTSPCQGLSFFPCNLFSLVGIFLGAPPGIANYYIAVFFFVVLIQGIFTGLIAGQIGEGSIIAGLKHSFIMSFSGIGVFIFLGKAGLLPI